MEMESVQRGAPPGVQSSVNPFQEQDESSSSSIPPPESGSVHTPGHYGNLAEMDVWLFVSDLASLTHIYPSVMVLIVEKLHEEGRKESRKEERKERRKEKGREGRWQADNLLLKEV